MIPSPVHSPPRWSQPDGQLNCGKVLLRKTLIPLTVVTTNPRARRDAWDKARQDVQGDRKGHESRKTPENGRIIYTPGMPADILYEVHGYLPLRSR